MLRCEVIMFLALNALKCRSHSAEDDGITNNIRAQSDNKGYICSCCPYQWIGSKTSLSAWHGNSSVS